jgi:hypothetical protein
MKNEKLESIQPSLGMQIKNEEYEMKNWKGNLLLTFSFLISDF